MNWRLLKRRELIQADVEAATRQRRVSERQAMVREAALHLPGVAGLQEAAAGAPEEIRPWRGGDQGGLGCCGCCEDCWNGPDQVCYGGCWRMLLHVVLLKGSLYRSHFR